MSFISLAKCQEVVTRFIDARLIPNTPAHIQWFLGGSTFLFLRQYNSIVEKNIALLKSVGLVNENNQINIDLLKEFINSSFDKKEKFEMFNFTFTRDDGMAFIAIMEEMKDV